MIKIGYILFNESLNSNLIKSQVINLLKDINDKYKIYLISFVPVYKVLDFYEIIKLNRQLQKYNIKVIFLPVTIPSRLFIFNLLFKFFSYLYTPILVLISYLLDIDIFHCRSYFATLLGVNCKKINLKLKVIFDTRSLFIEENVSAGNITYQSKVYCKWKKEEERLLRNVDKIIGIAEPFKEHFAKKIDKEKINIIPIFVDSQTVYFDQQLREKVRKKLNIENKNVIIYVGSFYGWNDPALYASYFKKMILFIENPYILILTKDKKKIKKYLKRRNICSNYYNITSCPHNEIRKYLSASDYGIIVMNNNLDSHTRLGVKFVEYLACNLIPITNSNVGAAANIVKKHNIGYVLDDISYLNDKDLSNEKFKKSQNIFNNYFNKELILKKYNKTYQEVL